MSTAKKAAAPPRHGYRAIVRPRSV